METHSKGGKPEATIRLVTTYYEVICSLQMKVKISIMNEMYSENLFKLFLEYEYPCNIMFKFIFGNDKKIYVKYKNKK